MMVVTKRCAPRQSWDGELLLPFELRQRSRLRTALVSGEELGLFLEHGEVLRDGDFLLAEDGRSVRVTAKPERVLDVICADGEALARVAYHLGNRHVRVQLGGCWLRIADDHVLHQMVEGLGASVVAREAPFEPEAGAYAAAHSHTAPPTHGGTIHEFGGRGEAH
jgi:urease accessory protein